MAAWGLISLSAVLSSVPSVGVRFQCPTCASPLLPSEHGLTCAQGHTVNVAKQGHVSLLPPRRVDPAAQAQDDERVRSTRLFFESIMVASGDYGVQAEAIADETVRALSRCPEPMHEAHILNVGCGEGNTLRCIQQRLEGAAEAGSTEPGIPGLWGTDESKLAVRYAAARQRGTAHFATAAPHKLPFADGSFSVVLATSTQLPWDEACRVLRPGGAVIVAREGPSHLNETSNGGAAADDARAPKQYAAGLAENYVRVCSVETFCGETARSLLAMVKHGGVRGADGGSGGGKSGGSKSGGSKSGGSKSGSGGGSSSRDDALEAPLHKDGGRRARQRRGRGASTTHFVRAPASERRAPSLRLEEDGCVTTTVDCLISTHRVWLGTGGEPL